MDAPIPTPQQDDDEDVHWALSTAGALWARGERVEALKWLRRAAEQASDANDDVRALVLFKAAAEVANKVGPLSVPPAAPPAPQAPPAPPTPAVQPAQPAAMGAPPAGRDAPRPPTPSTAPAPGPRTPPPPPQPARTVPLAAMGAKPLPLPPPRPGSVYPPPPVGGTDTPRPPAPSITAAPPVPRMVPAGPPPAPGPRPPSMANVVPPPSVLQGAGGRPAGPPVVAPPRAVAITNAKTSAAAQAIAPPKRRRSFTGESRAAAEKSRSPEPARPTHRARRRTFEEEVTVRQPLNVPLAPVAPVASAARAAAAPARPDPSSIFDDLDEDTRVFHTKPGGGTDDLIDQAFERLRAGNRAEAAEPALVSAPQSQEPAETPDDTLAGTPAAAFHREASNNAARQSMPAPAPSQPTAVQKTPIRDEVTGDRTEVGNGPVSGETRVWNQLPEMEGPGPVTERPASIPDQAPKAATAAPAPPARPEKRVESLPALRVAVLATSVPGEVRLIALGATDDAPPGAALAVLVPLSPADGESVTRLFGGLE